MKRHTLWLAFAALAILFSAGALRAEHWAGTFSLPSDTRWGAAVLPAGDYSFVYNSTPCSSCAPTVTLRQGARAVAMVTPGYLVPNSSSDKNQLLVVGSGDQATIHILYLADLGVEIHFFVPEEFEVYTRLITRADKPPAIELVPVVRSGK
ncbi:MAG TPA: hypothetical protein VGZ29_01445 [Terriglobia bacterium]|nr:hypothetical protein [Terriglobia bacterium]